MKTYLITGGAGFVGSNFILYLLKKYDEIKIINFDDLTYAGNLDNLKTIENDHRYTFIKGNICDTTFLKEVFKKNNICYVVNFAAESHVDRSIKNPNIFAQTNIIGTLNLLNIAKENWEIADGKFKDDVKFLQIGTDEVYGDLPTDRPDLLFSELTNLNPSSPYSASKASADLFVYSYYKTYGMPINITRCSNNYGPFQFPEKLIPLIINNALNKKELPVYGDGMQIRDWLYVDDHCNAIDIVIKKGLLGEVYNIGGNNEYTNIFIVKTIIDYIQKNIDNTVNYELIKFVEDRKGHDRRYAINPEKINSNLGWIPKIKFKDGIKLTIDWYIDNKDWMKKITSLEYLEYYKNMYGKNNE